MIFREKAGSTPIRPQPLKKLLYHNETRVLMVTTLLFVKSNVRGNVY